MKISSFPWVAALATALALSVGRLDLPLELPAAHAQPAKGEEDPLANIVVPADAAAQRPLPKIAVLSSSATDIENVNLYSVVRRDIDLSGEFDIIADASLPDGP